MAKYGTDIIASLKWCEIGNRSGGEGNHWLGGISQSGDYDRVTSLKPTSDFDFAGIDCCYLYQTAHGTISVYDIGVFPTRFLEEGASLDHENVGMAF